MALSEIELLALKRVLPASTVQLLRETTLPAATAAALHRQLRKLLAAITPFVPSPILAAPARAVSEAARGQYVKGTILVSDLDGLRQLLAVQGTGRYGSETTASVISDIFGALSAEIARHGGGVVKFIGDGLLALFDGDQLGDDHASWACAAALAMQSRLAELTDQPAHRGLAPLYLNVAAHSGRFGLIEVGDYEHRELLLTGHAMSRVMQVRAAAKRGETLISETTAQAAAGVEVAPELANIFRLKTAPVPRAMSPTGSLSLLAGAPPDDLHQLAARIGSMQRYLPAGLPEHLLHAPTGGGDFRPVAILFGNFCNFGNLLALLELSALLENDLAIIAQILNSHYTLVQNEVHRYGGAIHKVDMAPFGDRLMAVFGAPRAHEDDPLRAVQAAQAIRGGLDAANQQVAQDLRRWAATHPEQQRLIQVLSLTFRMRAAIVSGAVFAGVVGTPERHEYTLIGETVQQAAQLLAHAYNNVVLLSESTYRTARSVVQSQPRLPLTLGGGARPVPIYELTPEPSAAETPQPHLPLVGRHNELAALLAAARAALIENQGSRVVVVTGEPGLGKTRLAEELGRAPELLAGGTLMLHETCQSYEQAAPYAVTARLLSKLLRALPSLPINSEQLAELAQLEALLPDWARFFPLLAPLLGVFIPDTDVSRALAPEHRRERLHELIAALLRAAARNHPLALVVDDLQWADESSRALLAQLAQELGDASVLLALLYRSPSAIEEPWRELAQTSVIELDDLSADESTMFVQLALEGEPPQSLQPTLARAHGNPLLLEETLRYLQDSELLRRTAGGGWLYDGGRSSAVVPTEVERMMVARLDRADPLTREVAKLLAVMGQQTTAGLLSAVLHDQAEANVALDALVQSGLLVYDAVEAGVAYRYKHALLRDAIYESMLFAHRRDAHARLAEAIAIYHNNNLDSWRVVLAQHYQLAEQPEQAFPHFLAAAQQAQQRYANPEALTLYEQALATASQPAPSSAVETELGIYEPMGDIRALTGDYDGARSHYEALLRQLDAWPKPDAALYRARLQRKIGASYEQQGKLDAALPWLAKAREQVATLPRQRDSDIEQASILSGIGWLHFRRTELDEAQHQLEQALDYLDGHDADDERTRILNRLAGLSWQRGDLALAKRYVQQSLAVSGNSGDLVGQANALANLSLLTNTEGHYEEAARCGEESLQLHERAGSRRGMTIVANNVGQAKYDGGQFAEAEEWFERAYGWAVETRDTYTIMLTLLNQGRALTLLGQEERAEHALRRSMFLAAQLEVAAVQLDCHVALAELALQRNNLDAAHREVQLGAVLNYDLESEEAGHLQRIMAMLVARQGDLPRALALLEATETLFRNLQSVPEVERTRKVRAHLLAAK